MSGGFYAGLPASWELVVELIPKPWAREHAINDLRYQMDLVRLGRISALPTQRALETRWGWGWRSIARLVQAPEEWADEKGLPLARDLVAAVEARAPKGVGQDRGRTGAGPGQDRGEPERSNAANDDPTGQDRGRTGAGPGQDRGTRDQDLRARDHRSQITDHRSQDPEEEIRGPVEELERQPPAAPADPPRPTAEPPRGQVALLAMPAPATKPTAAKAPRKPAVEPPTLQEATLTPDEREALAAFRRLLNAMIGQPRCDWVRRPEDDLWLVELVRDVPEAIDVADELVRMQDWLDGQLRRKQTGKSSKFPATFKPFVRNWLTRQRDEPKPTHRDNDPRYRGVPEGYEPIRGDRYVTYGGPPTDLTPEQQADSARCPF